MIRFCFLFLLYFLMLVLEITAASIGIRLILLAPLVFYTTYVYGSGWGVTFSVISGMCFDFSSGLDHPWSILGLLSASAFASFWLRFVDTKSFFLLMVPGFFLPFPLLIFVPLFIGVPVSGFVDSLALALVLGLAGSIFLPLLIVVMDFFSSGLGLGTFDEARARYQQEQLRK